MTCIVCGGPTAALCDFVLEDGSTCDAEMCAEHRYVFRAAFVDPVVTACDPVDSFRVASGYFRRWDHCPDHRKPKPMGSLRAANPWRELEEVEGG